MTTSDLEHGANEIGITSLRGPVPRGSCHARAAERTHEKGERV